MHQSFARMAAKADPPPEGLSATERRMRGLLLVAYGLHARALLVDAQDLERGALAEDAGYLALAQVIAREELERRRAMSGHAQLAEQAEREAIRAEMAAE